MGKNLAMKQARSEKGLSQEALAAAVGVSRQTINAIEKGDYNPTIRLCISICRVLGLTLNELFWDIEGRKPPHLRRFRLSKNFIFRLSV